MPSFTTEVPHTLGKEKAVEKLRSFLEGVVEKYKDQVSKMEGDWSDNVLDFALTTYGFSISGKLTVEEDVAKLDGQLPFAAVAFRGKIEKGIAGELERALSSGKAAEADEPAEADELAAAEDAAAPDAAGEPENPA